MTSNLELVEALRVCCAGALPSLVRSVEDVHDLAVWGMAHPDPEVARDAASLAGWFASVSRVEAALRELVAETLDSQVLVAANVSLGEFSDLDTVELAAAIEDRVDVAARAVWTTLAWHDEYVDDAVAIVSEWGAVEELAKLAWDCGERAERAAPLLARRQEPEALEALECVLDGGDYAALYALRDGLALREDPRSIGILLTTWDSMVRGDECGADCAEEATALVLSLGSTAEGRDELVRAAEVSSTAVLARSFLAALEGTPDTLAEFRSELEGEDPDLYPGAALLEGRELYCSQLSGPDLLEQRQPAWWSLGKRAEGDISPIPSVQITKAAWRWLEPVQEDQEVSEWVDAPEIATLGEFAVRWVGALQDRAIEKFVIEGREQIDYIEPIRDAWRELDFPKGVFEASPGQVDPAWARALWRASRILPGDPEWWLAWLVWTLSEPHSAVDSRLGD